MKSLSFILFIVVYSSFVTPGAGMHLSRFSCEAANKQKATAMINHAEHLFKEGDIVLRMNNDPGSRYIRNFSRTDRSYSHAGIIMFENDYPFIYHMVNGAENPGQRMRKDSLSRFCDPTKNSAFGIFRYDLKKDELRKEKRLIHEWYDQGVLFDSTFNYGTDNRMYCSEMIAKALSRSTGKRIEIASTGLTLLEAKFVSLYVHIPFEKARKLKVIAIDNLYLNKACKTIAEFDFNK